IKIDCKPLEWWCRIEQRRQFPRLSRMAIDILSISPQSAEPERTFSGARRTAPWDRLSMTCERLQEVECLGNWVRNGHIVGTRHGGLGLVCNPDIANVLKNPGIPLIFRIQTVSLKVLDLKFNVLDEII
ncbi:hypothetical protein FOXB_16667, partial [Fusarium oxysporum f. sp. conglutinans Fo5176]